MTTTPDYDPILKLHDIELLYGINKRLMQAFIRAGLGPPCARWDRSTNSAYLVLRSEFLRWRRDLSKTLEQRAQELAVNNNSLPEAQDGSQHTG